MAEWITATTWQRLQEQGRALVRLDGHEIAVFGIDGQAFAIDDSCPHAGASLCQGPLNGHMVQCRAHGLRFDIRTGALAGSKDGLQARVYAVRVVADEVQVLMP